MSLDLSTFRIITYVILFLVRLRFPAQDLIMLRKLGNLSNLILNTEKLYWKRNSYNHAKNNQFRHPYSLK